MSKDPAFLFYPGDYLRDTQNLSEKTQVAYDRIMCEHMRNICISQQQLKFFTKRLSEDELAELLIMLVEVKGGYQIEWVADSINKRRAYSDSRRKNREGKKNEKPNNISKTYDSHMENEDENEDEIKEVIYPFPSDKFKHHWITWKQYKQDQFKFKYASSTSEQAALTQLKSLAVLESDAIKIIDQSMANGWKGFFELKGALQSFDSKGPNL